MTNRPDPVTFARYSYYLAFASAGILMLAFLLSLIRVPAIAALANIIWVALVTGIAGAFMGYAATRDFKKKPGPEEAMGEARIGLRINLGATLVTLVYAAMAIAIRVFFTNPIQVQ